MSTYCDTSIFIALYLPDRHAPDLMKLVAEFRPHFLLIPLHRAEWSHAVFERVARHEVSSTDAQQLMARFEKDSVRRWIETPMPEAAMERSMDLSRKHGKALGVTTADALHVACALELRCGQYWTVEKRCADLAAAMGLAVVRPGVTATDHNRV